MEKSDFRRLYIENLGCAKNQVDAEVMAKILSSDGWVLTDDAADADLILVNTCGFIGQTFFAPCRGAERNGRALQLPSIVEAIQPPRFNSALRHPLRPPHSV